METLDIENDIIPTIKSRTKKRASKSSIPLQDITQKVLNKGNVIAKQCDEDYSKGKKALKRESDDEEIASPIPIKSRMPTRKPLNKNTVEAKQPKRKISLPLISSSDEEDDFEEFKQTKRVIRRTTRPPKKVKFEESSGSEFEESSPQVVFDISSDEDSVEIFKSEKKETIKKEVVLSESEESSADEEAEEQDEELMLDEEEDFTSSSSEEDSEDDDYQPKKNKKPQRKAASKPVAPKPRKNERVLSDDEMGSEEETKEKPKVTLTIKKKKTPGELRQSENGWCFDVKNDHYVLKIGDDTYGFALSADIFEKLYSHQQIGVKWLVERHFASSLKGGLLADDMGLGKTIQISSFIHGLFLTQKASRVLVICPNSVVGNWQVSYCFF